MLLSAQRLRFLINNFKALTIFSRHLSSLVNITKFRSYSNENS